MNTLEKIALEALAEITHPETGESLTASGIVERVSPTVNGLSVTLSFARARDPFMNSIIRQVRDRLSAALPQLADHIDVTVKEAPKSKPAAPRGPERKSNIKRVLAVASGKGGVGKSTVTANLAATLVSMGYRCGILDADIYGPSMPKMFGLEYFRPEVAEAEKGEGSTGGEARPEPRILPAEADGIRIMSIGFFINPADALVWRGPMATSALRQMIHQTEWGELDFLLIDMPPGTGDVHLTILGEISVDGAVIVSTPQQVALADVVRGIKMFHSKGVEVPVVGIVENMAWFTPAELPQSRYYIFGRGGAKELARQEGVPFLGEIPVVQSLMEGGESGKPGVRLCEEAARYYREVADNIVKNLP